MASNNDGGPAYPVLEGLIDRGSGGRRYDSILFGGMSVRDVFAKDFGASLVGDAEILRSVRTAAGTNDRTVEEEVASQAYLYADAMIAEREARDGK